MRRFPYSLLAAMFGTLSFNLAYSQDIGPMTLTLRANGVSIGQTPTTPYHYAAAGAIRFLQAPEGTGFAVSDPALITPTERARGFLTQWATEFGVTSSVVDYDLRRVPTSQGRTFPRFRQTYSGLVVFGGEVIVQMNASGDVEAVMSRLLTDTSRLDSGEVSLQPNTSTGQAILAAFEALRDQSAMSLLTAASVELVVYEPALIGNPGVTQLAWLVNVKRNPDDPDINEMVFVNAHSGVVVNRYSLIHDAKNRQIFDAGNSTTTPGTLVRAEGGAATGIADADFAYDYFGDTYDFYMNYHGRDSIDGVGMIMSGTVRYCANTCPWQNASWNGSRMHFGLGFAVGDDVCAHELTHGVTQYESDLVYQNQSGAINESFSDIWGEWVDQTNGKGVDTPAVKWLMGEDLSIGAIRSMMNPPSYSDPDRMGSSFFYTGTADSGGVHINSGVGNKLAFLLTDGQTFNGRTVVGMGVPRVSALYYEAQTTLLNSSSQYMDLYFALKQAAVNLGWTLAEKDNLEQASIAVEISPSNKVYFVKPTGNDGADGLSWATAKRTIGGAMIPARGNDRVWVAAGTYVERIVIEGGVSVYGGFAGTETELSQRNFVANVTTIDGAANGSVVTFTGGTPQFTRIDGFTIRNGTGALSGGSRLGGGILADGSSPTIANNRIHGNTANYGAGIYNRSGTAVIANNVIYGNSATLYGGGIRFSNAPGTVANNTIVGNSAGTGGGAVAVTGTANFRMYNNIVASNNTGLFGASSSSVVSRFNNYFSNGAYIFSGLTTSVSGDITSDPRFVNPGANDYHLLVVSEAIDKGDSSLVVAGTTDMDGQARINGLKVDMGADEYYAPTVTFTGTVKLDAWLGAGLPMVDVSINGAAAAQMSLSGSGDTGTFTLQLPPTGDHAMWVKPVGFLAQKVVVTTNNVPLGANFFGSGSGLAGADTDGTNSIDDADITNIIIDYGTGGGASGVTDANGDGAVDDADLTLSILNFALTGDV